MVNAVLFFLLSLFACYLLQSQGEVESGLIYLIPFIVPLLFAVDCNADAFQNLTLYRAPTKSLIFFADLVFWGFCIGGLWVTLNAVLIFFELSNGLQCLQGFVILYLSLIYGLLIKIRFLESGLMRGLGIGFSVVLPLVIPVFAGLGIWEILNDKN